VSIIAEVDVALKRVFGSLAEQAAQKSGVIQRRRKFTPVSLAQTWVLGFLENPQASDEELAQMAVKCGAAVTPQAIDQRHTPPLADFFQKLFAAATQWVVRSDQALAPILDRFPEVTVLDSSTITLPDSVRETFPGCGGRQGSGQAAMKLQTELELRGGAISSVEIEPGRHADATTSRQYVSRPAGSLRIADLGYFSTAVFAEMDQRSSYFLSRLQFGTTVFDGEGVPLNLLAWLARQKGPFIDAMIQLGQEQRLSCRLIAWRLPTHQADRRRQKLCREKQSKKGRKPSRERLAWCDWTILVTNVPAALVTPPEAVVLYRARWQIELLFKRWKSQGLVADLDGSTDARKLVRVWARLLAALVQHWLLVSSAWGDATKSLVKVAEAVRAITQPLAIALTQRQTIQPVLAILRQVVAKTCRRNKRSQPGTFELLNNVSLLDFRLT